MNCLRFERLLQQRAPTSNSKLSALSLKVKIVHLGQSELEGSSASQRCSLLLFSQSPPLRSEIGPGAKKSTRSHWLFGHTSHHGVRRQKGTGEREGKGGRCPEEGRDPAWFRSWGRPEHIVVFEGFTGETL